MDLIKTKLTKAVLITLSGGAVAIAAISDASASTTMYNLFHANGSTPCAPCSVGETDGWVWGGISDTPPSVDPAHNSASGWVGTSGTNTTPFGLYAGGASVNWAVRLDSAGDSAEISNADAIARYGVSADIDTAKGSWSDANLIGPAGPSGWRHDLDMGLFKSDVAQDITLTASGVKFTGTNFGFTIFKGMDTGSSYVHHSPWNSGSNQNGLSANSIIGNGTSFTVADIVAYSVGGANPSNLNAITFHADAGQIYTIALGGYRNGSWIDTNDGYVLQVAAVPVPAAVWLFGSAAAAMVGLNRRRKPSI